VDLINSYTGDLMSKEGWSHHPTQKEQLKYQTNKVQLELVKDFYFYF